MHLYNSWYCLDIFVVFGPLRLATWLLKHVGSSSVRFLISCNLSNFNRATHCIHMLFGCCRCHYSVKSFKYLHICCSQTCLSVPSPRYWEEPTDKRRRSSTCLSLGRRVPPRMGTIVKLYAMYDICRTCCKYIRAYAYIYTLYRV